MNVEEAKQLGNGDRLHYTGKTDCERRVGPRGGVTTRIVEVRVSGQPQTWKRDANRVKVPIKYGMYENSYITESNVEQFHLASECPVLFPSGDSVDSAPSDGP